MYWTQSLQASAVGPSFEDSCRLSRGFPSTDLEIARPEFHRPIKRDLGPERPLDDIWEFAVDRLLESVSGPIEVPFEECRSSRKHTPFSRGTYRVRQRPAFGGEAKRNGPLCGDQLC